MICSFTGNECYYGGSEDACSHTGGECYYGEPEENPIHNMDEEPTQMSRRPGGWMGMDPNG